MLETRVSSDLSIPQTRQLFRDAFGREISEEFLRWRFIEGPFGRGKVASIWKQGQMVSHYGGVPMALMHYPGGAPLYFKACLIGTVMSSPLHRGQGMFQAACREHDQALRLEGYDLVYGFPNANSAPIFAERLGWQTFEKIRILERRTDPVAADVPPDWVSDDDFQKFDYGPLSRPERALRCPRNNMYLHWRFRNHPTSKYSVAVLLKNGNPQAYAVTKTYRPPARSFSGSKPSMDWVDFGCAVPDSFDALVQVVLDQGRKSGATHVQMFEPIDSEQREILASRGFQATGITHELAGKGLSPQAVALFNKNFPWSVSMSDSDVF